MSKCDMQRHRETRSGCGVGRLGLAVEPAYGGSCASLAINEPTVRGKKSPPQFRE